ncbi:class I SAM-dependent methyltransferase [Chitinophaga nivalis]|uniref:Class I SAM-dependent methyltransferase n=1 Tax=Chitinophaga nivalis TaxID=2991709 RepID=A0ABT3IN44_9BACT|nr:class I SAM-dependent methyltransferase [Chitinophaga nivalis]MCW3464936.1 class I SAM-dependent methyltransferase [Chitinophaga nivalis]MCW3485372.1 class I SAM-dependent methyltransferase [Chitinophaga nivalis]
MMQEIAAYWDKQSAIWREEKQDAWTQPVTQQWLTYFKLLLPRLQGNRVLEVGTASGYFANILAQAGYEVTAVDISENMITEAKAVSAALNVPVNYQVMDAQQLAFPENRFDLVFTRLMTWTTPDVKTFYRECFKVLTPGGLLLNFDGDFGACRFSQEGHEKYPADIMEEANRIKSQLDISKHPRPAKDVAILQAAGFVEVSAAAREDEVLLQPEGTSDLFELKGYKPLH